MKRKLSDNEKSDDEEECVEQPTQKKFKTEEKKLPEFQCWCGAAYSTDDSGVTPKAVGTRNGLVYQQEICPTTARPHYQWFLYHRKPINWRQVQKIVSKFFGKKKHHVENCISQLHASNMWAYCQKNDTRAVDAKSHVIGVFPDYIKGAEAHNMQLTRERAAVTLLFLGPSGTGKSTMCRLIMDYYGHPPHEQNAKSDNQQGYWLGPYKGQEIYYADEFNLQRGYGIQTMNLMFDPEISHSITTSSGGSAMVPFTTSLNLLTCNETPKSVIEFFHKHPSLKRRINLLYADLPASIHKSRNKENGVLSAFNDFCGQYEEPNGAILPSIKMAPFMAPLFYGEPDLSEKIYELY